MIGAAPAESVDLEVGEASFEPEAVGLSDLTAWEPEGVEEAVAEAPVAEGDPPAEALGSRFSPAVMTMGNIPT